MHEFYVYQLRLENSETPFYIGKGRDLRISAHFLPGNLKKRSHKNNVIKKAIRDGVPVLREKLHEGLTEEQAHAKEIELIAFYGRRINGGCLTNATDGGEGVSGYKPSVESIEKMKSSKRGKPLSEEHRQKISDSMRGKTHGEQMRARVSIARTGAKHSEASRAKMSEIRTGKRHALHTIEKMQFSRWDKNPVWRTADEIYEAWLNAGKPGREKFNEMFPGTRELSRKFAKSWVPSNDETWKRYKGTR